MAKKKTTRDIPLPSSDGMFGGPGNPKKTASDNTSLNKNYMVGKLADMKGINKLDNTMPEFALTTTRHAARAATQALDFATGASLSSNMLNKGMSAVKKKMNSSPYKYKK